MEDTTEKVAHTVTSPVKHASGLVQGISAGFGHVFRAEAEARRRSVGRDVYLGRQRTLLKTKGSASTLPFLIAVQLRRESVAEASLADPAAADHDVAVVEDDCLAGSDGALRRVEGDKNFVVSALLYDRRRSLVTMADLGMYAHRLA